MAGRTAPAPPRRSTLSLDSLYRTVFERSPIAIQVLRWRDPEDPDDLAVIAMNPASLRHGQLAEAPPAGSPILHLFPVLRDSPVIAHYRTTLRQGSHRWSIPWDDPEGATRVFEVEGVRLDPEHLAVLYADVTEREQQRDLAHRRVRRLRSLVRQLDQFAHVASHDLRAPLRDIQNLIGFVLDDVGEQLPAESRAHLELASGRAGRMDDLLVDLLTWSRAGRAPSAAEPLRVAEVVEQATRLALVPRSFDLRLDIPEALQVISPRAPLALVVRNLVANAWRHHDRDEGTITVRAEVTDDHVMIEVSDDGPGIPEARQARVFEPFTQLDPRRGGTGMGLALVWRSVDQVGGTVTLLSQGRGTRFRVTWPHQVHLDAESEP